MDLRGRVNRKQVREGGGGGANLHFDEMIGSYELNIYRHRNNKIRGLDNLEQFLQSQGCQTVYISDVPAPVGPGYDTIRVTCGHRETIPVEALRRAHSWAHRRNFLHMFRKPGASPGGLTAPR